ncbi:MAG: hypothetical protein JHD16_07820, partial [Solirubrobacteraceae bacterium]|nr:hypothetical protein [Solirubrobacteraceae bacterium]
GLLTLHLHHIPAEGDSVVLLIERFEAPNVEVTLTATQMHGLRVDRVHVALDELPDEHGDGEDVR